MEREEALFVRARIGHVPRRLETWVVAFLAPFALFAVPLLILQSAFPVLKSFQVPILVLMVASGLLLASFLQRRRARSGEPGSVLEAELAAGQVEEALFAPTRAMRAGEGWLLELEEETQLYLEGEHVQRELSEGRFPNREIRVVRLSVSRTLIDFACVGEPLAANDERGPFGGDPEDTFEDGDLIEARYEELRDEGPKS